MQYEVWELRSRSLVAAHQDEDQALDLVRRLLADGSAASELVFGPEDEDINVESLPLSLTGSALTSRLAEFDTRRAQSSA
jgi:hypothetical protein